MRRGLITTGLLALVMAYASPASAGPCDADPCKAGCADGCFIHSHETDPTKGVPVHWSPLPVKYKINASRITTGLDKAKVLQAVQDAFKAWEGHNCSNLTFKYEGESTSFTEEAGMVLVYWDYDPAYKAGGTWTHGDSAYWVTGEWTDYIKGEISKGIIGLNSTPNHPKYKYDWSLTEEANKFHISMISWLLPTAIGLYVGDDQAKGTIPLFYGKKYALCQSHKDAAAYTYFDSAGAGCTKPAVAKCSGTTPPPPPPGDPKLTEAGIPIPPDTGTTPNLEGGTPPGLEPSGPPPGDGVPPSGEPGTQPPPEDDDGCCRVSHARSTSSSVPYLALAGLALLFLLGRRRRK